MDCQLYEGQLSSGCSILYIFPNNDCFALKLILIRIEKNMALKKSVSVSFRDLLLALKWSEAARLKSQAAD